MPESQVIFPIRFDQVELAFGSKKVLNRLSFEIAEQGVTAIMGPNGAGKSLCLRMMAGLIQPDSGQVLYHLNKEIPRHLIGFVFQRPVLLRRSVLDNLVHALKLADVTKTDRLPRALELLELGELLHHATSPARKLSGGEQQRLALLRALAAKPKLLFLDEPCASLDPYATMLIERVVQQVAAQGVKVVLVTHDQGQASRLSSQVIFIHQGRHIESNLTKKFLGDPASQQAKAYLAGQLLIDQ